MFRRFMKRFYGQETNWGNEFEVFEDVVSITLKYGEDKILIWTSSMRSMKDKPYIRDCKEVYTHPDFLDTFSVWDIALETKPDAEAIISFDKPIIVLYDRERMMCLLTR